MKPRRQRQSQRRRTRVTRGAVSLAARAGALALVTGLAGRRRVPAPAFDLGPSPVIRVALARQKTAVPIAVDGPYRILSGKEVVLEGTRLEEVEVRCDAHGLRLGRTPTGRKRLHLHPENDGTLVVAGKSVRGTLVLIHGSGGVTAVNHVPLESYVAGVLGAEMPLRFPEAALAAQSVAARSYALYHQRRRRGRGDYDVRDDTSSQVYRGMAVETPKARRVVRSTRGVVVTYEGRVLQTYFHSTCGGGTVPAKWVFGEKDIPPFRGAPCDYCRESRYYRWTTRLPAAKVAAALAAKGVKPPIRRVSVSRPGPRGHADRIRLEHAGGTTELSSRAFRKAIGPRHLRSTRFRISLEGDQVVIRGGGWGHGVGLCQWGARGMALEGKSGREILAHYYPGATLVRLGDGTPSP